MAKINAHDGNPFVSSSQCYYGGAGGIAVAIGIMVLCAFAVRAETISLLRNDSTSAGGTPKSFASAGNWSIAAGKTEAEAPNPAYDYYSAYSLSTVNNANVGPFGGKSLTIGNGGGIWWFGGWYTFDPGTDIIAMESGTYFRFVSFGSIGAGTFAISGTEDAPVEFLFMYQGDSKAYDTTFSAAFTGTASSHVRFYRPLERNYKHIVNFGTASMPDFYGTLYLCEYIDFNARSFTTPGSVVVGTNDAIVGKNAVFNLTGVSANSVFGALDLGVNAAMTLASGHMLVISNRLSATAGAKLSLPLSLPKTWPADATSYTFLTLGPNADALDCDAIVDAARPVIDGPLPHVALVPTVREDGGTDMAISSAEVVVQTNHCGAGVATTPYGGTANPASYFSDGLPISGDKDYYSDKHFYIYGSQYEFPGRSFTHNGGKIGLYGGNTISFRELNLMPSGKILNMSTSSGAVRQRAVLNGKLNAWGGTIQPGGGMMFEINADIGGPSNLVFRLSTERDAGTSGIVALNGDNSAFAHRIVLGEREADSNLTLCVSSATSLGGDMAAFTYDGLYVRETCKMVLGGTNVFNAANRGWFFDGAGEIEVTNDAVAVVRQPVTFGTSLAKTGGGSLVLGVAPKFYDSGSGTAIDASNGATLDVAAGSLGAAATNAFSGLTVTFAAGTSYVLPFDSGDEAFAERGADLTAAGTSLTFVGETPVVAIGLDAVSADHQIIRGLFTVSDDAAAAAILAKLRPHGAKVGDVKMTCSLFTRSNGDGSVTVCAKYFCGGMTIIFK